MFSDLRPYPRTTSSSIPWAPELPAHWTVQRGKALFRRVEREPRSEDGVVTCFRDGVVTLRSHRRTSGFTESLKEIGYQGIRKGDLVIHAMDAFAGAAGVSDSDGKGTPVYSVCVPLGSPIPHYYAAVVREMARSSWIQALSRGVRERSTDFRFEMFATQQLPVPPAAEQAAIVNYLAHANARIDEAIAAKRRLIVLLQEEKAAMLARVIGEARGERFRLKHVTSIQTGLTLGKDYRDQKLSEYPYLRVANVQMGHVDTTDVATVAVPAAEAERCMLRAGDVLMTEGGDIDKLGRGTVWDGSIDACLHQNHVFAVRCSDRLVPEFLAAWLAAPEPRLYFYVTAKKTTNLAATNSTTVRELPIVVPSSDEQRRLLAVLRAQSEPVDLAKTKAAREIELLHEFRGRLVADLVTGQVDVRGVAKALPEIHTAMSGTAPLQVAQLDELATGVVQRRGGHEGCG